MARRRRSRGHHGMKLPIISLAILGGQVSVAMSEPGPALAKVARFARLYTGFDMYNQVGTFHPEDLAIGYGPWLLKRFILPIAHPRMPVRGLPISLS